MTAKQTSTYGPIVVPNRPVALGPFHRPTYVDPQPHSAYRPMTPQPIQLVGPTIRVGSVPVAQAPRSATPAYSDSRSTAKDAVTSKEAPIAVASSPLQPVPVPSSPTRKGFEVRRSTDTPKPQATGSPYLNRRPSGISQTDLAAQRSAFAAHCLDLREANLKKLAVDAKMSADNARHSLLLLAYTSRQWRKQTSAAHGSAAPCTTPSVPILDLYRDGLKYVGVLQDIDNVMSLPTVVATNDEKNMYQKVLQNLSELGLFRPYATPRADWESTSPGAPARGQRRVRLSADQ